MVENAGAARHRSVCARAPLACHPMPRSWCWLTALRQLLLWWGSLYLASHWVYGAATGTWR